MKKIIGLLVIILIIIGAVTLVKKRKESIENAPSAKAMLSTVVVYKPKVKKISESESFLANLQAMNQPQISSKLSGYLKKIYVKESDFVKKGDLLAELDLVDVKAAINQQQNALDASIFREKAAISHVMANYDEVSKDMIIPEGVELTRLGDEAQFKNSAGRMVSAIGFAVILIFFTLVPMFNSVKISFLVIVSIPLTIIGAAWIMLILNYHTSMPAMMGFMLLSGIIVNNAILLIHFAIERMDLD